MVPRVLFGILATGGQCCSADRTGSAGCARERLWERPAGEEERWEGGRTDGQTDAALSPAGAADAPRSPRASSVPEAPGGQCCRPAMPGSGRFARLRGAGEEAPSGRVPARAEEP